MIKPTPSVHFVVKKTWLKTHVTKTKTWKNCDRDSDVKICIRPGLEAQKVEKHCFIGLAPAFTSILVLWLVNIPTFFLSSLVKSSVNFAACFALFFICLKIRCSVNFFRISKQLCIRKQFHEGAQLQTILMYDRRCQKRY